MLNIVTVHWQSPKWIAPQLDYLERNVDVPFRVFAALNGIEDRELHQRFHFAEDLEGTHAEKLNALARVAIEQSDPSDWLVFLDGDAFPVQPVGTWVADMLTLRPLAAVRRDENLSDPQPHPCFCVTTCGFWDAIDGDWREGGTWTGAFGKTTDVGGTLMHQLAECHIDWLPILRTNTCNPDPLWFGVYGHRIYHHGAGFRPRISRIGHFNDTRSARAFAHSASTMPNELPVRTVRRPSTLAEIRPRVRPWLPRVVVRSLARPRAAWRLRTEERAEKRERRYEASVFAQLCADPQFFRSFDSKSL